jgi:taurine dioxygenase
MGEAFEIRPLTPCIGAEVHGLDLRKTPGAVLEGELERALLDHLVLFFRDQDLSPAQQLAFGRCFGKVSLPPIAQPHPDEPDLMVFDQTEPSGAGADTWHTDAIWIEKPPKISMLRAVQLPAQGGDTCFANMYDAYDDLSAPIRSMLDGLQAVQDITAPMRMARDKDVLDDSIEDMQHRSAPVHHPVVRTHPDTGRKALYITGNSTTEILGLSPKESTLLLEFLLDHVQSPQYQCRFRWEPNSLALWDNRCTLHFGVPDYHERRVMYRLCVEGDAPA